MAPKKQKRGKVKNQQTVGPNPLDIEEDGPPIRIIWEGPKHIPLPVQELNNEKRVELLVRRHIEKLIADTKNLPYVVPIEKFFKPVFDLYVKPYVNTFQSQRIREAIVRSIYDRTRKYFETKIELQKRGIRPN